MSASTKKTRASQRRATGGGRETKAAPRGALKLIDPNKLTTRQLVGIHVFGLCAPRLGVCVDISDANVQLVFRKTDRLLARNEKAIGAFHHREQLGWVFRQLVKTADALGVSVSSIRAVKALRPRLQHDPLADAMLTVAWVSTLMTRTPEDNDSLQRDTLREAVARARAINAGGTYRSKRDKARAARLRELMAGDALEAA